jgi:hypothetical protein
MTIPITTAFYEFRSANLVGKDDQGPNYKLDGLQFQVANTDRFHETLDRVGDILRVTHRGNRGLRLRHARRVVRPHRENVRSVRASGGIIAGSA